METGMAAGQVLLRSLNLSLFILFYLGNTLYRGPNQYLSTSLLQLNALSDCYPLRSFLNGGPPSIPPLRDSGHIGFPPTWVSTIKRSFLSSRISRYTSPSSTVTFQLLKKASDLKILLSGDIELNPGPMRNQDGLIDLLTSLRKNRNGVVIVGHSNVRGLYGNLNQVRLLLKYSQLDVIAITETHLNESIDDSDIFIEGYCLWRLDRRNKHGGGVAFYVKRNIDCELLS